jgi:hypothetical protein
MEPNDDLQLRNLLREWQVQTPPSLEKRVLTPRQGWWHFLLTGYVRVPVPVAVCLLLLMGAAAWRTARPTGMMAPCTASAPVLCAGGSKC